MSNRRVPSQLFTAHETAQQFLSQALQNLRAARKVLEAVRMSPDPAVLALRKKERRLNSKFCSLDHKVELWIDEILEELPTKLSRLS